MLTAWQDCRFRAGCTANDVVVSRSADGKTWSAPVRVTSGRNVVLPTIGVEPGTGRLAIAYYVLQRNGIDAELITSSDGTRWSAPQRLNARRMPLEWMPQTTLGRMLADYIGVSWVRGRPLVVLALASPPRSGQAAAGDLRRPRLAGVRRQPRRQRRGRSPAARPAAGS